MSLNVVFETIIGLKIPISLTEVNELDITCKSLIQGLLENRLQMDPLSALKIQGVIDYTYERINIGNWKDVSPVLRKTMTIASYLKLLIFLKTKTDLTESVLKESFQIIDYGLLFGCPLDNEPQLLQKCASILNEIYSDIYAPEPKSCITTTSFPPESSKDMDLNGVSIKKIECPSMEYFYTNHILKENPVILDGCINRWPALSKWKDQNYLLKLAGLRTVPVELGSKYTDSEWTQKLMTLQDFMQNHIFNSNSTTGYLAQYQLFDQIPELKNDISEPEYCCFSDSDEPVDINAWFGPKGTVSPLHHDPKKNLLAQVVGSKLIYLYPPSDTEFLYPHDDDLLNNTARVDPREPDLELYPKYKDARAYSCVLKAGQMLYIPPKWWHFVESLSVSFSVSFWWN